MALKHPNVQFCSLSILHKHSRTMTAIFKHASPTFTHYEPTRYSLAKKFKGTS
ncbi:hypothetical protein NTGM5_220064 [Candidatus Nitrotoga sp. M5]|nr:hypothetical protein NTGM5_220064 [Candidatus Nitrotoga sp. M5]